MLFALIMMNVEMLMEKIMKKLLRMRPMLIIIFKIWKISLLINRVTNSEEEAY